jgi:hypothetical protein
MAVLTPPTAGPQRADRDFAHKGDARAARIFAMFSDCKNPLEPPHGRSLERLDELRPVHPLQILIDHCIAAAADLAPTSAFFSQAPPSRKQFQFLLVGHGRGNPVAYSETTCSRRVSVGPQ